MACVYFWGVNFYLFSHNRKSLSNAMREVSFNTDPELRAWLEENFESKPGDFYQRCIRDLVEC